MSAYKEQLSRVERWLIRIENQKGNQIEYVDFLWSFFQNCWHMKDWLENDDALPKTDRGKIVQEAHGRDSLKICADLANKSKHLQLTRKPHHDNDPRVIGKIGVAIEEPVLTSKTETAVTYDYVVSLSDGSSSPVLDIARTAVNDWKTLLSKYGLL